MEELNYGWEEEQVVDAEAPADFEWDEPDVPRGDDGDWDVPEEAEQTDEDRFLLKYMGREESCDRETVVTLAQKGMDYDRVRSQLDTVKEELKEFRQMKEQLERRSGQLQSLEQAAAQQGLVPEQLLEELRVQSMARETGLAPEVCRRQLRQQQENARQEAQLRQIRQSGEESRARRDRDFDTFMRHYPQVLDNVDRIPGEVWRAVEQGESLTSAYRAYEIRTLRAQLAEYQAAENRRLQREENRRLSTGSQSTDGQWQMDPLDALWYNGE